MIPIFAFLTVFLAAGISALPQAVQDPPTSPKPVDTPQVKFAKVLINELKSRFTVDTAKPPQGEIDPNFQAACPAFWLFCPKVGFYYRHILRKFEGADIDYIVHDDTKHFNAGANGTDPVEVTSEKSVAVWHARSQGWKVGVTATATSDKGAMSLNIEYSDTVTITDINTSVIRTTMRCPASTLCKIETWSLYAKVRGKCERIPMVRCSGNRNMCSEGDNLVNRGWTGCQQFLGQYMQCDDKRWVDCSFNVPIQDNAGKPYSVIVPTQYKPI
ncbi:hypothetical protein LOZ58_005597 [Ophidiomyces ophidiicola]|nr:hypothetical protein LOZ58_005597 [Ophidiomyces ophidiicola]